MAFGCVSYNRTFIARDICEISTVYQFPGTRLYFLLFRILKRLVPYGFVNSLVSEPSKLEQDDELHRVSDKQSYAFKALVLERIKKTAVYTSEVRLWTVFTKNFWNKCCLQIYVWRHVALCRVVDSYWSFEVVLSLYSDSSSASGIILSQKMKALRPF